MKFCSLNWHYRSQWKPNQVNRVSKRIIVDFSGLRTGSEQEQVLEASMPYSEGQSTAVPTAPKLCFKLSTTKSVCRVSEVQQPPGSCRPSSDALQQDCEVLPSNVHVCLPGRAWGQRLTWGRAVQPLGASLHVYVPQWQGSRLRTGTEALQTTPCEFIVTLHGPGCLSRVTSWCQAAVVHSSSCGPRKDRTPSPTQLGPTLNASRIPVIPMQIP